MRTIGESYVELSIAKVDPTKQLRSSALNNRNFRFGDKVLGLSPTGLRRSEISSRMKAFEPVRADDLNPLWTRQGFAKADNIRVSLVVAEVKNPDEVFLLEIDQESATVVSAEPIAGSAW